MIELGFLLGLAGSVHCAGMCGPLMLILPGAGSRRGVFLVSRMTYHAGRMLTYGLLGAGFGLVGQSLILAGWQRWLSIAAGAAILAGLALSVRRDVMSGPVIRFVAGLKLAAGTLLRQRTLPAFLLLGGLNGLLPCGLVYAAGAGAVAAGDFTSGITHMLAFGLGTLPMLLTLSLGSQRLPVIWRMRLQKLVPFAIAGVGLLLIARGLGLGIPYLSPALEAAPGLGAACH